VTAGSYGIGTIRLSAGTARPAGFAAVRFRSPGVVRALLRPQETSTVEFYGDGEVHESGDDHEHGERAWYQI
jgi:hypothetical protein